MPATALEIAFLHCAGWTAEAALPCRIADHLAAGQRVLVRVDDRETRERLDGYLWTYEAEAFLPHAAAPSEDAADQPVLLDAGVGPPANGARLCILLDPAQAADPGDYSRLELLFDDGDEARLAAARSQWAALRKRRDVDLSYWRTVARDRWERVR